MNQTELLHYLQKKPDQNLSALGFFRQYQFVKAYQHGESVIALGQNETLWAYVSSSSRVELENLLEQYQFETSSFASVEDWMIPLITGYGEVEWRLDTHRFFLPPDVPVSPPRLTLRPIPPAFASRVRVLSNYQDKASLEYIVERLENGPSSGVFIDGQLIGWCLTHDDGSLGVLHVLPEHRRKGYALEVARDVIHQIRNAGLPVLLNVVPGNTGSLNLVSRLGFVYDRDVSWLTLHHPQGIPPGMSRVSRISFFPSGERKEDVVGKKRTSRHTDAEKILGGYSMLTFAEEILLLILDDQTGTIRPLPPNTIRLTLTGALLMELALENRIDTDLDSLKVVSTEPTGDPLLDEALLFLQRKKAEQKTSFWLNELTLHTEGIQERIVQQLVKKGVLKIENRKLLWMFHVRRYPIMDNREIKEVRNRLRELVMSDEIPDSREVVLISLVSACQLFEYIFSSEELARWKYRIESLARLDLIGQQVGRSIVEINQALATTMPVC